MGIPAQFTWHYRKTCVKQLNGAKGAGATEVAGNQWYLQQSQGKVETMKVTANNRGTSSGFRCWLKSQMACIRYPVTSS